MRRDYASIKPWIRTQTPPPPDRERLQSPEDRRKLENHLARTDRM